MTDPPAKKMKSPSACERQETDMVDEEEGGHCNETTDRSSREFRMEQLRQHKDELQRLCVQLEEARAQRERADQDEAQDLNLRYQLLVQVSAVERQVDRLNYDVERTVDQLKGTGVYFSPLNDVWGTEAGSYNDVAHFNAVQRDSHPTFMERRVAREAEDMENSYELTCRLANESDCISARDDESVSTPENQLSTKLSIWPVDIFGRSPGADKVVNLVPTSAADASTYSDVARWVFALPKETDMNTLQKIIHGTKKRGPDESRIPHTGLRQGVTNKIRIMNPGSTNFEKTRLFFVPTLSLAEAKVWNGTGYKAIALAFDDALCPAARVYRDCGLGNICAKYEEADQDAIDTARQLLKDIILGLAYSLHNRHQILSSFNARHTQTEDGKDNVSGHDIITNLLQSFKPRPGAPEHTVTVPSRIVPNPMSPFKVAMVSFVDHKTEGGHPAPDPILLAVKAAINWSWQHNQKLLASPEDEELEDELSILAEEEYLEYLASLLRPKTWEELAKGLHQPNGYQEDDTV